VVLEEADESLFWLDFLVRVEISRPDATRPLRQEADELVSIFTVAHKKAKAKLDARITLKRRK